MSSRSIYSRPRTRVYDVNYNIGESYYKSAIDRLDRKYSGRATSPASKTPNEIAAEISERHASAFAEEDLATSRRRAEKHIVEDNLFDARTARVRQSALNLLESSMEDETASTLKRIRANKKISQIDDVDLETTSNNLKTHRLLDRAEKILDTVGITDSSRRALDEDVAFKRRAMRLDAEAIGSAELTKWTPILPDSTEDKAISSATLRARQSRERINDIEDEMVALAEKQALRERRVARLKQIVAESEEDAVVSSSSSSMKRSVRSEKKSVKF